MVNRLPKSMVKKIKNIQKNELQQLEHVSRLDEKEQIKDKSKKDQYFIILKNMYYHRLQNFLFLYYLYHKIVTRFYFIGVKTVAQKPIDLKRICISMIQSYVCLPKKDGITRYIYIDVDGFVNVKNKNQWMYLPMKSIPNRYGLLHNIIIIAEHVGNVFLHVRLL